MTVNKTNTKPFRDTQIVNTSCGVIEGHYNNGIAIFKGIPFAAPPVGDLRWKAPQPLKSWTGTMKTQEFKPGCPQNLMMAMMPPETQMSEDCLYLNVWTPAETPADKLPVLVWIYGGGFNGGMTSIPMYDGMKLAAKGIVFVSIAYRIGSYGFLAHPELSRESGKGSGNYGLQDMISALKWVSDNINAFGGDNSKITIFGHSAGGIATSMLAASPKAKGLFHGVISMSGGSFAPSKFGNEPGQNVPALGLAESTGEKFLEILGVKDIKAARALSVEQIQDGIGKAGMPFMFWPVEDGDVITGDQYNLYTDGKFNDTPILVGSTSDEAGSFLMPPPPGGGSAGPFGSLPASASDFIELIKAGYGPAADAVISAYLKNDNKVFQALKGIMRDNMFGWHTWTWARFQSNKGKNKAFVYYFDQHGSEMPDGAGHGADVSYAFKTLGALPPGPAGPGAGSPPNEKDYEVSDLMSSYFVNFTKTGNPNGPGLPDWPAFRENEQKAMIFNENSGARPLPNVEKQQALEKYYAWRRDEAKKRK